MSHIREGASKELPDIHGWEPIKLGDIICRGLLWVRYCPDNCLRNGFSHDNETHLGKIFNGMKFNIGSFWLYRRTSQEKRWPMHPVESKPLPIP